MHQPTWNTATHGAKNNERDGNHANAHYNTRNKHRKTYGNAYSLTLHKRKQKRHTQTYHEPKDENREIEDD